MKLDSLVSVIIPTKNSAKHLRVVLEKVFAQSYEKLEVLIVDNDSSDGTRQIAQEFNTQVLNKGPERSDQKNFGVSNSRGEYVLILDSDCELEKNVIKECVELCQGGADGVMIPLRHKGSGFWVKAKNLERICYDGDDDLESPWFIRRSAFKKVGGFNTNLVAGEDWDIAYRLRKEGYILVRNRSVMHHNLDNYSVKDAFIGKFYYGRKLNKYLQVGNENVRRQIPFFRTAYIRNWKRLLSHPLLTLGFIFLKFVESAAVLIGLVYERIFSTKRK